MALNCSPSRPPGVVTFDRPGRAALGGPASAGRPTLFGERPHVPRTGSAPRVRQDLRIVGAGEVLLYLARGLRHVGLLGKIQVVSASLVLSVVVIALLAASSRRMSRTHWWALLRRRG